MMKRPKSDAVSEPVVTTTPLPLAAALLSSEMFPVRDVLLAFEYQGRSLRSDWIRKPRRKLGRDLDNARYRPLAGAKVKPGPEFRSRGSEFRLATPGRPRPEPCTGLE